MKLFFILSFFGFFTMLALYLRQDIEYFKETNEKLQTDSELIEGINKVMAERKRPLLKGLRK